jgi:DNA-binding SARP family transcriptional activator
LNPDEGVPKQPGQGELKLRLLGFPSVVTADGAGLTGLGPGKPLALLAYLVVRGEARREELVDLLWGEVSESNARNAFRQALHRLRQALGESVVPMERDRVRLERSGLRVDRNDLLESLDRGDLNASLEIYRGDFLEGFDLGEPAFDAWADAERTRLRTRLQSALRQGGETALSGGRWVEALQYVQRLTTLVPFDEDAAFLEANILVAAGRPLEALGSLRRFAQVLRDQLDLTPAPKIRDLISRLERAEPSRETFAATARSEELTLVGRESEIVRLMNALRALRSEKGATILLEGAAGIGKTRLIGELIARAKPLGPLLVLRGRERPIGTSLPYASIAEALRASLRAPGIAGTGKHLLAEAARILPELKDNFELPEPEPVDTEGGRLRFFEGVAAMLDSAAYEQPVCLVLDDMHHASPSTIELLAYLSARLHSSPILIVAAFRPEGNAAALDRLRGNQGGVEGEPDFIALSGLDPAATKDLIRQVVQRGDAAGQIDVERLAVAAGGHPLRAIELARRAVNGELPQSIPARLQDILWSRLQRASPSQRRVFFAAALLQRRCSLRLLATAAHLPELATYDAAHALEEAGLLLTEGDGYVIAHDFTQGFVADASGTAGRALLAGWAADALAAEPKPPSAELAGLYAIAGQPGVAFEWARRAVYDAAALGSSPEVQRLLGQALALAPDGKSREQVEAILAAFGAGKPLLQTGGSTRSATTTDASLAAEIEPAEEVLSERGVDSPRPAASDTNRSWARLLALSIVGLLITAFAVEWRRSVMGSDLRRSLRDSLLVLERRRERSTSADVISGPLDGIATRPMGSVARSDVPLWVQALQLPWIRPSVSSSGLVAIERMTTAGTDVYLMADASSAPVPIATGKGMDAVLGWSPDGQSVLVRQSRVLADGSVDADLWAYRIALPSIAPTPIDTSSQRAVEEAAWSPDGSRVAWVARTGPAHQRDVFISYADGSAVVNATENPGEDYHISWSSDGSLLGFTSDRDGNPDIFALEIAGSRLWRLTRTPGDEDFATFSPDNRSVAYQSTAGGDAAVYVMPALGGAATRVTPTGRQFSILGWRGKPTTSYVDRLRIIGPSTMRPGDSASFSLIGADKDGNAILPENATIGIVAAGTASPGAILVQDSTAPHHYVLRAPNTGTVRLSASIPGWRYDSLTVDVGQSTTTGLGGDFSGGLNPQRWIRLGSPRPTIQNTTAGWRLLPDADLEWQSGILSRDPVSLSEPLLLRATFAAPFNGRPIAAASLTIAIVEDRALLPADSLAPRFNELVALTWDGEASRFTYSVGSDTRSEPVSSLAIDSTVAVRIEIDGSGRVAFFVGNRQRWVSSVRFIGTGTIPRGRVWISGRATRGLGAVEEIRISRP